MIFSLQDQKRKWDEDQRKNSAFLAHTNGRMRMAKGEGDISPVLEKTMPDMVLKVISALGMVNVSAVHTGVLRQVREK